MSDRIIELKAAAYDIMMEIEAHYAAVVTLRQKLQQILQQIADVTHAEQVTSGLPAPTPKPNTP